MSSENAATGTDDRYVLARMRANSQISHFGTSSGPVVTCDRCHKPANRWNEPCTYDRTAAAMLAEDVLWLLDQVGETHA